MTMAALANRWRFSSPHGNAHMTTAALPMLAAVLSHCVRMFLKSCIAPSALHHLTSPPLSFDI